MQDGAPYFYRRNAIEYLEMVACAQTQREYERNVPIADVPGELLDQFVYSPELGNWRDAFAEEELRDLAEYHRKLMVAAKAFNGRTPGPGVEDILVMPEWIEVMKEAQGILDRWLTR